MFVVATTICLMSNDANAQVVHSHVGGSVAHHHANYHVAPVHGVYYNSAPIHNAYYHGGHIPYYGYGGYGGYGHGGYGGYGYSPYPSGYGLNTRGPYDGYIPF